MEPATWRWASVRAGLIALVIAFGLVDGCPLPAPGYDAPWQRWYAVPLREVQRVVEWPVAWLRPGLRIAQQWALYQAPGGTRYRMSIDGQDAHHDWVLLFRAADPEHAEDANVLTSARVRGVWHPTDEIPVQYPAFVRWVGDRFLARHPELVAIRVRMEKVEIIPGGFAASGEFVWPGVRTRGDR